MISIREYEDRKTEERGWTDAFSAAVTRMESEGGGTLVVPAGRYETFPIELKSNMTLYLTQKVPVPGKINFIKVL